MKLESLNANSYAHTAFGPIHARSRPAFFGFEPRTCEKSFTRCFDLNKAGQSELSDGQNPQTRSLSRSLERTYEARDGRLQEPHVTLTCSFRCLAVGFKALLGDWFRQTAAGGEDETDRLHSLSSERSENALPMIFDNQVQGVDSLVNVQPTARPSGANEGLARSCLTHSQASHTLHLGRALLRARWQMLRVYAAAGKNPSPPIIDPGSLPSMGHTPPRDCLGTCGVANVQRMRSRASNIRGSACESWDLFLAHVQVPSFLASSLFSYKYINTLFPLDTSLHFNTSTLLCQRAIS